VYSFGGVLLELISGHKAIELNCPEEEESNLIEWVRSHLHIFPDSAIICINGEARGEVLAMRTCLTPKGPRLFFCRKTLKTAISIAMSKKF